MNAKCKECGHEFEFAKDDTEVTEQPGVRYYWAECPECGDRIILIEARNGE